MLHASPLATLSLTCSLFYACNLGKAKAWIKLNQFHLASTLDLSSAINRGEMVHLYAIRLLRCGPGFDSERGT